MWSIDFNRRASVRVDRVLRFVELVTIRIGRCSSLRIGLFRIIARCRTDVENGDSTAGAHIRELIVTVIRRRVEGKDDWFPGNAIDDRR